MKHAHENQVRVSICWFMAQYSQKLNEFCKANFLMPPPLAIQSSVSCCLLSLSYINFDQLWTVPKPLIFCLYLEHSRKMYPRFSYRVLSQGTSGLQQEQGRRFRSQVTWKKGIIDCDEKCVEKVGSSSYPEGKLILGDALGCHLVKLQHKNTEVFIISKLNHCCCFFFSG